MIGPTLSGACEDQPCTLYRFLASQPVISSPMLRTCSMCSPPHTLRGRERGQALTRLAKGQAVAGSGKDGSCCPHIEDRPLPGVHVAGGQRVRDFQPGALKGAFCRTDHSGDRGDRGRRHDWDSNLEEERHTKVYLRTRKPFERSKRSFWHVVGPGAGREDLAQRRSHPKDITSVPNRGCLDEYKMSIR